MLTCPKCHRKLKEHVVNEYNEEYPPFCDNTNCDFYDQYFHVGQCAFANCSVTVLLRTENPENVTPASFYCAKHENERWLAELTRRIHKKFADDLISDPERAYDNFKRQKIVAESNKILAKYKRLFDK